MSPASLCQLGWHLRRGGRVVEGARLERVYTGNRIKGSNPFLSARWLHYTIDFSLIFRRAAAYPHCHPHCKLALSSIVHHCLAYYGGALAPIFTGHLLERGWR
jgi:hypothetical protein